MVRGGSRFWLVGVVLAGALLLPAMRVVAQSPSAAPAASPAGTPFVSVAYHYTFTVPAGWTATPALVPWDGAARVDSTGGFPDDFFGPRGILFFVFGAPTDLELLAYADQQQQNTATWHGCPATPEATADAEVSGVPARLHTFGCQGYTVHKLMAVLDGNGLVVNQIGLPDDPNSTVESFLGRVGAIGWPSGDPEASPLAASAASGSPVP